VTESSLRSLLQRATRTWQGRLAWAAGTLVVAAAIVVTALLISAPRPDATLRQTAAEADDQVRTVVTLPERARWYEIDTSTLRAYGSYHGLKIWSGVNAFGSPCLVAVNRAGDYLSPVADEDNAVFKTLRFLGSNADESTIRGYQPYRGVEPVFHMDRRGYQCLRIIERSGPAVDGANCVPPGVDLFADIGVWPLRGPALIEGLPDGSIVRFHYRGHSVDVFLYPASKAD
jgi:hypothetical protein